MTLRARTCGNRLDRVKQADCAEASCLAMLPADYRDFQVKS
jgi:hypothetical protein